MKTSKQRTYLMAEGAVCLALALVLGSDFAEVRIGAQGGSLSFAMLPLIIFAVHSGGLGWGVGLGVLFGTLKFFIGGGVAVNWQSMLLDYSLAYGAVGLAGIFKGKLGVRGYLLGAIVACVARFLIHYISGVTIYAEYAADTYLGVNTPAPWIFSIVYNGFYMVFNTIAAVIAAPIVGAAITKIKRNK